MRRRKNNPSFSFMTIEFAENLNLKKLKIFSITILKLRIEYIIIYLTAYRVSLSGGKRRPESGQILFRRREDYYA